MPPISLSQLEVIEAREDSVKNHLFNRSPNVYLIYRRIRRFRHDSERTNGGCEMITLLIYGARTTI